MRKLLMLFVLAGMMPLASMAQDDVYFIPGKSEVQESPKASSKSTYYSGSNRSIDDYNRYGKLNSWYQKIGVDSLGNDIITFKGPGVKPDTSYVDTAYVYPGSANYDKDYSYTRRMSRWDGYYDPYYYDYCWNDPWYNPWCYGWYGGWYDPWYYGYAGWYDPWYYGYYGWGWPYRYGWYDWGWSRPVVVVDPHYHDYVRTTGVLPGRTWGAAGHGYQGSQASGTSGRIYSGNTSSMRSGSNHRFGGTNFGNINRVNSSSMSRTPSSFGGGSFGGGSFGGGSFGGRAGGGCFGGGARGGGGHGSFGGGHR